MNDFQDQAKNWLRNVVKQNPDKIKAGVEKAGDLIDKQTGGKYAEKVDSVQEKVGSYVDSHADPSQPADAPGNTSTEQNSETTTAEEAPTAGADEVPATADSGVDQSDETAPSDAETVDEAAPEAVDETVTEAEPEAVDETVGEAEPEAVDETVGEAEPEAVDGSVVGGDAPEVTENPSSSTGSGSEGTETGGTATGPSTGGLPGPR